MPPRRNANNANAKLNIVIANLAALTANHTATNATVMAMNTRLNRLERAVGTMGNNIGFIYEGAIRSYYQQNAIDGIAGHAAVGGIALSVADANGMGGVWTRGNIIL